MPAERIVVTEWPAPRELRISVRVGSSDTISVDRERRDWFPLKVIRADFPLERLNVRSFDDIQKERNAPFRGCCRMCHLLFVCLYLCSQSISTTRFSANHFARIISLSDSSLPTKPCRTCKNRFHASCLFKWFNSSHSSSCPMCRTLF